MAPLAHSASRENPNSLSFMGREREQARLRDALDAMLRRKGSLVLIGGEAGIGKTSLVGAFMAEAERDGVLLLIGNCYDLSITSPYGPWIEMIERFPKDVGLPSVPTALKPDSSTGEASNKAQLFRVARDFFNAVARNYPLVLVLEDLHWSDPASIELLRYLARQVDRDRILIVATYREDEVTRQHPLYPMIPILVRESNAVQISLRPIDEHALRNMVELFYPLEEPDLSRFTAYVQRYGEGNPLFVWELLRALEDEGQLTQTDAGWSLGGTAALQVPKLLTQLLEGRLNRLQDEQRKLLNVAAVIGQVVPLDLWQQVAEVSDELFLTTVERASEARILSESVYYHSVSFSHSLVREVIYKSTSVARRRVLHRKIGENLLENPSPDPDTVAYHLERAGDPRAADWLIAAGERAQRSYALLTAADRFERASDLLKDDQERRGVRGWLLYRVARQLRFADLHRGIAYLEEAEQIGNAVGDRVLAAYSLADRAYIHANLGHYRCAYEQLRAGHDALEVLTGADYRRGSFHDWVADVVPNWAGSPSENRSTSGTSASFNPRRGLLVAAKAQLGQLEEAVEIGEQYRAQLASLPNRDQYVLGAYGDVCSGLSLAYARLGRPDDSLAAHSEFRQVLHALNHRVLLDGHTYAILQHVILPFRTDDLEERRRLVSSLDEISERLDDAMPFSSSDQIINFEVLWLEGRWDEVMDRSESALRVVLHEMKLNTMLTLANIARARGETITAWEHIRSVLPGGMATGFRDLPLHFALAAQEIASKLALDEARLDLALEWIDTYDRWMEQSGSVLGLAEGSLLRARYCSVNGNENEARSIADEAFHHASDPRQPRALIAAERFLGELATENRNFDEADAHLQSSLELVEACVAPFERALTLLALAELRAATGDVREARALLDEVEAICQPLGAKPTLERADRLRQRITGRRPRSHHPSGLTAREVDVLRLLAQGMTDKEIADELFISHHTVMRHVSHILGKLEVDSRSAAAAEAVRLGLA